MKKKIIALFLAMVMCMTMVTPTFASDFDDSNSGIMPCEDMDGCLEGHTPPSGYTYEGYRTGNSYLDAQITGQLLSLTGYIPVYGYAISKTFEFIGDIETIAQLIEYGQILTWYHQYTYIKGSQIWYHTIWFYQGADGHLHQLTCAVDIVYVSNR